MRRVVITGVGAISPHGFGAGPFWNALLEGKSSIAPLTRFDPSAFAARIAGVVPAFKTADFVPKSYRKATKIMARDIELAVIAADFAVRDAKVITRGIAEGTPEAELLAKGWFKPDPARIGCNIGAGLICADLDELTSAMAEVRTPENQMDLGRWGRSDDPTKLSGMDKLTPLWLLKYLPNMLACHVSIIHDTQGPSNTITCGQASAGLALAEAARTIERGQADMALVGGCESKVHPMGLMRWSLLGMLNGKGNDDPARACRPYDKRASGAVLGEGGAVFMIEEYEHAKKRGATIYAELAGFGGSSNASESPIQPDITGEAPAVAMKKAIKDAGIAAADVQVVIPAAYAIPEWDRVDVAALKRVFGENYGGITVLAGRGGVGECGAGSQALDIATAAMAMREQTIPASINVDEPIENLPIARQKTAKKFQHALVLSCALGGQNSAVVLRQVV
jgi:3-oxoacyl-[acyl-carrier-protein] synthase II